MSRYIIRFSNGDAPIEVDGWVNVQPTLEARYGRQIALGHDGDMSHGGDETMFWTSDEYMDDGLMALGNVRRAEEAL